MENYWKPVEKEIRSKYVYIIQPENPNDLSMLYDAICKNGFKCKVCENKKETVLEVETASKIDLSKIPFPLSREDRYELIDDLNSLDYVEIRHNDRRNIFSRLKETTIPTTNKGIGILLLGMIISIVLCYMGLKTFNYLYFIGAIAVLTLTAIIKMLVSKKVKKDSDIRLLSNEDWLKCQCQVICSDKEIKRDEKTKKIERNFLLAQGGKVIRYWFKEFDVEFEDLVYFYIRANSNKKIIPEETYFENGELKTRFNGNFTICPENYVIPDNIMEIILKYEKQEEKARERAAKKKK